VHLSRLDGQVVLFFYFLFVLSLLRFCCVCCWMTGLNISSLYLWTSFAYFIYSGTCDVGLGCQGGWVTYGYKGHGYCCKNGRELDWIRLEWFWRLDSSSKQERVLSFRGYFVDILLGLC